MRINATLIIFSLLALPAFAFAEDLLPTPEALVITGDKVLTFTSRSIEGTKEGFVPGVTREESLKLTISGKAADTEINANIFSTATTGTTQVTENEDKISVLLRHGATEAYFGDFTAYFSGLEFANINKVLQGVRLRGDYDMWGFEAIGSSPKGDSRQMKMYGNGTQGPYYLGSAPVVINSEKVFVNGAPLKRGDDYDIDYEAGNVTFRKKVIQNIDIIQVDYEYRETLYQHSTYAFRLFGRPYQNLNLGATYINDSDSLSGARAIHDAMATPVDPKSHQVFGIDGSLDLGSILMSKGEFAYSDQNLDLLSSEGTKEVGKAFKLETISIFGPLSLGTRFKRVGPAFQSIGDANPKQDVWESGGSLSYSPSDLFFTETIYSNEKFSQSGVAYANTRLNSKAKLTPANFPSLAYFFNEDSESNDPVSGSVIDRLTVRNAVETRYRYLFLDSNLRGSIERRLNREPSAEATIYRILSFGTSTFGLEKIMASGNIELKNTELPDGSAPFTRTVNLAVSAAPSKEYFTSASITQIDDTEQGSTNVTELAFKAEPQPEIRTDGKYTISAVQEDFSGTEESVSRQVGSLKLDYRPMKEIRIGYIFKPDFTMLARSGILTYNNGTNQTELLWSPAKEVSTGLTYRINNLMLIDKSDPMFSRRDETRDTNSLIYSIKYAPFRFLSTEFDYSLENFISKDLTTAEPVSYLDTKGKTDRYDAIIRTPLSERLSIDSRYSYEKITEGTGEAISNSIDTLTQTASLKTTWNISDSWSLIASGSYSTETDNLASGSKETYTVSPGFGFICRLGDTLRVDAEYTYSRSYSGEATEMSIYSLEAKYNLSQIVHITFRGEQELSIEPNYKTTDILTNIEINL